MAKFKVGDRVRFNKLQDYRVYGMHYGSVRTVTSYIDNETITVSGSNSANGEPWRWPDYWFVLDENLNEILATNDKNKLFRYLKDHLNA